MRCGVVSIIGRPNAGKSTLLNGLIGEKISIVSRKVQTTRMRIMGVLTSEDAQVILVDTPGIFDPKTRFEKSMVREISAGMDGADLVLLLIDVSLKECLEKNKKIIEDLAQRSTPLSIVLNKIDLVKKDTLLLLAQEFSAQKGVQDIFMVSATQNDGVEGLKKHLLKIMPAGHWLYPEDQLSNLPERLFAAEITREQIFNYLHDELPYQMHVVTEQWETLKNKSIKIYQTIYVTHTGHRAMALGKNGQMIKRISQSARTEIDRALGIKAHLFLNIKVDAKWQERKEHYHSMGMKF